MANKALEAERPKTDKQLQKGRELQANTTAYRARGADRISLNLPLTIS